MRREIARLKSKIMSDYKVELLTLCSAAVVLILLCAGFSFRAVSNYTESVIDNYAENQEVLVAQIARETKASMETFVAAGGSLQDAELFAAADVIAKTETSGTKYWFFYSSDGVIYEKNAEETNKLKGKNLADAVRSWRIQGGSGAEAFQELLDEKVNGSVIFTKSAANGQEIVSLRCFAFKGQEYYVGTAAQRSYVMSNAGVNRHILYLFSFAGVVCLNLALITLFLCLTIYKNRVEREKNKKSITDKNLKIEELTRKVNSTSEAVQNASIYDSLTKLYNRKFFDSLLTKIRNELLYPISILVMDINGLSKMNANEGYDAGDALLENTSAILHRVCLDTDVVARTGSSEFTVLMTNTKEEEAYGTAENIRRQFFCLDTGELSLSIGVAQMHKKDASAYIALEGARKNLLLDKMMDRNSLSHSIVAMLMKTLNAYSSETVSHCDRLREMSVMLGKALGMNPAELSKLAVAAQLHDVGKIGIPDSVLKKKEILSHFEKDIIRRHSEIGFKIVKSIPALDEVAIDILQHHEFYNGKGYPNGFKAEEISLNARIISIIDSFDAMINPSVYKRTMTIEEAVAELRSKSGMQYDPYLVNEFVKEVVISLLPECDIGKWIL